MYKFGLSRLNKMSTIPDFEEEYQREHQAWFDARSFAALVNLNKQYLLGRIPSTPYVNAPVHEEVKPFLIEST